jgi:hypothetical protein
VNVPRGTSVGYRPYSVEKLFAWDVPILLRIGAKGLFCRSSAIFCVFVCSISRFAPFVRQTHTLTLGCGGPVLINFAIRRKFCAVAASRNSSWAPVMPHSLSRQNHSANFGHSQFPYNKLSSQTPRTQTVIGPLRPLSICQSSKPDKFILISISIRIITPPTI